MEGLEVRSGLVTSGRPYQLRIPSSSSPNKLATFVWNNCRVAKDHRHAAITPSTGFAKLYA